MLPASSGRKPGASTQTTVPIVNSVIAIENTWRVEKRPIRKPVSGITTAMVSMKPVVSHCAVSSLRARSAMVGGGATERIVAFRLRAEGGAWRGVVELGTGGG